MLCVVVCCLPVAWLLYVVCHASYLVGCGSSFVVVCCSLCTRCCLLVVVD